MIFVPSPLSAPPDTPQLARRGLLLSAYFETFAELRLTWLLAVLGRENRHSQSTRRPSPCNCSSTFEQVRLLKCETKCYKLCINFDCGLLQRVTLSQLSDS